MTVAENIQPNWVSEGYRSAAGSHTSALAARFERLRSQAMTDFAAQGLPSPSREDWKYTNVVPLAKANFTLLGPGAVTTKEMSAARSILGAELSALRAVFINGHYISELSALEAGLSRCRIATLASLLDGSCKDADLLRSMENYLGTLAPNRENSFAAMNMACVRDGIVVFAPRNSKLEAPLHIAWLNGSASERAMVFPRVLVVAEDHSEVAIIETFQALDGGQYLSNQVTEICMAPGAKVDHYKIQLESEAAFHYGAICAATERNCEFRTHTFSFGGTLVRNEVYPTLNGEGGVGVLNGLTVLAGSQHADNTTVIDHAKPHCESHELYKGIYGGRSSGAFSGTIIVRPDAQKTNALQTNQSLLLSPDAHVDSRPQLKIWADDVKCTHGATIGQLDENALFYLRSRGVPSTEARNMLIHAFASDVISGVRVAALRTFLEELLSVKLQQVGAL